MIETQGTIAAWAADTFGDAASDARVAARANEEMAELLRHVTSGQDNALIVEEAADVMIVLYRLCDRLGMNLDMAVQRKMAVNRRREWQKDGSGHGYHVRS